MSTIQFDNGMKVQFDGEPTPQDVEEVANKIGISQSGSIFDTASETSPTGHVRPQGITNEDVTNAQATGNPTMQTTKIGSFLPKELLSQAYQQTVGKVANVGVNAYNLGVGFKDIAQRNYQGARGTFGTTRNLPFLGPTAPIGAQMGNGNVNIIKSIPEALGAAADIAGLVMGGEQLIGKASNFLANRAEKKATQEALDVTAKQLTKKEAISTLKQSGAFTKLGEAKGTQTTGLLNKVEPIASSYDRQVADSVKGLVKSSALPTKNIVAVNKDIATISQKVVSPILEANPKPFNTSLITKELNTVPSDAQHIAIQSDATLNRAYNLTKQRMLQIIQKGKQDTAGLWKSQQTIDDIFSQSKNPAIQQAWKDLRVVTRTHIVDASGEAGQIVDQAWKRMNAQYEAINRIATKGYKTVGTDVIQRSPRTVGALKTGLKYLGRGAALGVGAGGAYEIEKKLIGE